jgi:hypothetical protein
MNWDKLVCLPSDQLALIDPLVLNLEVVRGIPAFAQVDVAAYQTRLDGWL